MDLIKLNYFRVVAQYEHMTKAAESLHISQPSLSATISRLEKEIGFPLFERSGNRIRLNENGKIFLRHVNRMYTELDSGLNEVRNSLENGIGKISFCTYGPGITNDLIPRFMLSHPNVSIIHDAASPSEMTEKLNSGEIDFAISTNPVAPDKYNWEPLYVDYMLALLPSAHPLAGREPVNLSDLSHEHFALFNADQNNVEITLQLCKNAGFSPDIIYAGNDIALIMTLVANNVCVFLCQASNGVFGKDDPTTSDAKTAIFSSLCFPNIQIPVGILSRKDRTHSPPALEFIQMVKDSYSHFSIFEEKHLPF